MYVYICVYTYTYIYICMCVCAYACEWLDKVTCASFRAVESAGLRVGGGGNPEENVVHAP